MASQNPLADRSNPPTTKDTTPITMLSHGRLNGKVALVTGGAVGFGAGTSATLVGQSICWLTVTASDNEEVQRGGGQSRCR